MDFRLVFLVMLVAVVGAEISVDIEKEISKSNQHFAYKIYNKLMTGEGNIVMSPISVQILLTLIENGARGDTHLEMCQTLSLIDIDMYLPHIAMGLMNTLNSTKYSSISLANLAYFDTEVELKPKFFIVAELAYNVMVKVADLTNKDLIAEDINRWVSVKTKDEISQIVNPRDVGKGMLLLNSLYFQGRWKYPFTETGNVPFYLNAVQSKNMECMSRKGIFKHAINIDLDSEIIQIPYLGDEVTLTIVMPRKRDGLFSMEEKIQFAFEDQQWKDAYIHLTVPKFRFENTIHFRSILKELGIEKAFNTDADFSGITETKVGISTVIQKTYIDVYEHGTSVQPAEIKLEEAKSNPVWKSIVVDHPFVFMVEHVATKTLLYMGRVVN